MITLRSALAVELRKFIASRTIRTTSVLLALGIGLLAGALVVAARAGDQRVLDQLGTFDDDQGWSLLLGVVAQIIPAGALLGFGVALSWNIGREFADGTIGGLFALPVHRGAIVLAKLIIHLIWVVLVAAALTLLVGAAGIVLDLGHVDTSVVKQLARQFVLTVLTGVITVPVAWVTSVGRSMLAGIGATIAIIVAAQISVLVSMELAAWNPFAVPAVYGLQLMPIGGGQFATVGLAAAGFGGLTLICWRRLQLDR